jgi:hypothetical protein
LKLKLKALKYQDKSFESSGFLLTRFTNHLTEVIAFKKPETTHSHHFWLSSLKSVSPLNQRSTFKKSAVPPSFTLIFAPKTLPHFLW